MNTHRIASRFHGYGWLVIWLFAAQMAIAANWTPMPASNWRSTTWNGEKAWEATSCGWTAVVSEERARLVAITEVGHSENLLFATPKGSSISWGGHRCWLGPQSKWKPSWPPSADWEASAAAEVKAAKNQLTIIHPHTDKGYPPITRTYEWRDGILHCSVSWQGANHHAVQILQIPKWSIVHLRKDIKKDVPMGYALLPVYRRPDILINAEIPAGISSTEGDDVTLWHANISDKIGFAPQEITADIGNYQLKMRRGKMVGFADQAPDLGLLTQVYLGNWENPFVEIEQISPFGSDKPVVSKILVEPLRRKAVSARP